MQREEGCHRAMQGVGDLALRASPSWRPGTRRRHLCPRRRLPFCTPPLRPQALPGVHMMSLTSFPGGRGKRDGPTGRPSGPAGARRSTTVSSPRRQRCPSVLILQVRGAGRPGRQDPQTLSPTTPAPWLTHGTDFAALPPSPARGPRPQRDPRDSEGGACIRIAAGVGG